ncbi:hypothetical protein SBV1_2480012 [Verrucomicrobia bacterium]|nr:hypothetical protein SBV1_2480012 [Verrucomicrobiota bacterium]
MIRLPYFGLVCSFTFLIDLRDFCVCIESYARAVPISNYFLMSQFPENSRLGRFLRRRRAAGSCADLSSWSIFIHRIRNLLTFD